MQSKSWTKDEILKLYDLYDEQNKSFSEIAGILNKSESSVRKKYKRTDWDTFLENPTQKSEVASRPWTREEMIQVYTYMDADKKDYQYIANKLNRSAISVERKIQTTDWVAWKQAWISKDKNLSEVTDKDVLGEQLVNALLQVCRHDFERLKKTSQEAFCKKINFDLKDMPCAYTDIKNKVEEELVRLGYGNPENIKCGEGTYIIVGDSHGKFTKDNTFKLLSQVASYLKPKKIFHVGHLLDDDNDISYNWGKFKNLVIISKHEELSLIQERRHKFNFTFEIVRDSITLGEDLDVTNQDMIQDYVITSIKSLDAEIFDERVIVNCHRMEFHSNCSNGYQSYFASPGCLCEPHIIKTIKQINFEDGRVVKEAKPESFIKYRRMRHMHQYWKQGFLVVHVDAEGKHTIIPCLIQNTSKGLATSYFDKIITTNGLRKPSKKIFVNGDLHSTYHCNEVLDVQEQVVQDYKPDVFVTIGDTINYSSLNHHLLDKGIPAPMKVIEEAAQTHYIMKRMAEWANEKYALCGNHERFAQDFIDKNPQFQDYLNFDFLCDIYSLGYKYVDLKDVLSIGPTNFVHGDIRMYGQRGSKPEKASRTFGKNGSHVFVGHTHSPSIRFDSYTIGLSGQLDQDYNEPTASTWVHGFGLCNHFGGKGFPTTIAIVDNTYLMKDKAYVPVDPDSWDMKDYKARLKFSF